MNESTTLIIMAAGIGSRFGGGGLKQLSTIDDAGNIIMDYSVYDAVAAGFDHVVFVIRRDTHEQFEEVIGNRIEAAMAKRGVRVSYVFQELEELPDGCMVPEGRTKPWGTGQAVLACRKVVDGPFLVINADDYYGKDCYGKLHAWLTRNTADAGSADSDGRRMKLAMAGFVLCNTVSENGTVTRGICRTQAEVAGEAAGLSAQTAQAHMLAQIIETKGIHIADGRALCSNEEVARFISPQSTVSMNMWAGYPDFLDELADGFAQFLGDETADPLTKEYLIPEIVDGLLQSGRATVEILDTDDKWIGITYREDLQSAREAFSAMIADGQYPRGLWR